MGTVQEDEVIIAIIEDHECIYNKKHGDHYKNSVKTEIYQQIAGFLEIKFNSKMSCMYYGLEI